MKAMLVDRIEILSQSRQKLREEKLVKQGQTQ